MRWSVLGALPGEIFLINKSQVHERPNCLATKRCAAEIIETAFTHVFLLSSSLLCPAEKEKGETEPHWNQGQQQKSFVLCLAKSFSPVQTVQFRY